MIDDKSFFISSGIKRTSSTTVEETSSATTINAAAAKTTTMGQSATRSSTVTVWNTTILDTFQMGLSTIATSQTPSTTVYSGNYSQRTVLSFASKDASMHLVTYVTSVFFFMILNLT